MTVVLQTCIIFKVSLTPILLDESIVFILVLIIHAIRTKHMVAFQSFVNELPSFQDIHYPSSLMASEIETRIFFIYTANNLYVICSYLTHIFITDDCIGQPLWYIICVDTRSQLDQQWMLGLCFCVMDESHLVLSKQVSSLDWYMKPKVKLTIIAIICVLIVLLFPLDTPIHSNTESHWYKLHASYISIDSLL